MRDDDKPAAPTRLTIRFNGTAEQLENLLTMLEKLRLPDDEAPSSETQSSYALARSRGPDGARLHGRNQ